MGERQLLLWIHAHSTPARDRLFLFSQYLGDARTMAVVVAAMAAWAAWRRRGREAATWLLAGVAALLAGGGTKLAVARPRPHLWPLLVDFRDPSFPSGHALGTAVVFSLLAATVAARHPRLRLPAFAVAALLILYIGLGRLYLGVHWPTDVLGGWALGFAIAILARRWQNA